jgi:hypothetical protein
LRRVTHSGRPLRGLQQGVCNDLLIRRGRFRDLINYQGFDGHLARLQFQAEFFGSIENATGPDGVARPDGSDDIKAANPDSCHSGSGYSSRSVRPPCARTTAAPRNLTGAPRSESATRFRRQCAGWAGYPLPASRSYKAWRPIQKHTTVFSCSTASAR